MVHVKLNIYAETGKDFHITRCILHIEDTSILLTLEVPPLKVPFPMPPSKIIKLEFWTHDQCNELIMHLER